MMHECSSSCLSVVKRARVLWSICGCLSLKAEKKQYFKRRARVCVNHHWKGVRAHTWVNQSGPSCRIRTCSEQPLGWRV